MQCLRRPSSSRHKGMTGDEWKLVELVEWLTLPPEGLSLEQFGHDA
jgi:hypothetical protein